MRSKMEDFSDILIVTDLDGTFFGQPTCIVERNMEAIDWLKARGGMFTIATGRVRQNMNVSIPQSAELVNAPVIVCNGAMLFDLYEQKVLEECPISHTAAREVIDYSLEHFPDVGIRISVPDGFVTLPEFAENNPLIKKETIKWKDAGYRALPIEEWDSMKWYKLVFRGKSETLDQLRDEVEQKFSDTIDFSKSGPTFFEAQNHGINKSTLIPALREYCSQKKGKPVTVVCCGDYENDIEMLKEADISVCPQNALDEVKAVSDLCLCHCSDGLIADVVEYLAAKKGIEVKFSGTGKVSAN